MKTIWECVKHFGYLFYIVDPKEASYENVDSVPDYITQVIPYFVTLILIEQIITFVKSYRLIRINDAIASLSQGILMELSKALFKGLALMSYIYIYRNWRICSLNWQNTSTWIIAFIAVDFGFYWIHRFTHEINVLWAAHQVHHSSQEYNLTTALRQSVLHLLFQYMFYMPLAVVIPPTTFLVHNQFNVLYQFWIHTQLIQTIGPLEYILNTPSHHRVHHGRNKYCIDKNYGGVLIIWDRLFGTFQMERHYISYGLTKNINTFNPFTIQMHHYFTIFHKFNKVRGFRNKINCLFAGPAWDVDAPNDTDFHDYETPNESGYYLLAFYLPFIDFIWFYNGLQEMVQIF
ncbi:unnamed protein product [Oppiella nova]|uniref:Fatty acid hydroxylase domain-containing protein n=1 Tax=Oppiella nova TaxID=334625 RepID=A0A7R9MB62_9ACAR|nr:unnamed protein product [Oppiella nova]CAG2174166.1 unnamed protein product [Oppiella nova]